MSWNTGNNNNKDKVEKSIIKNHKNIRKWSGDHTGPFNGPQLKTVMDSKSFLDKVLNTKGTKEETQENKRGPKTKPWGTPPQLQKHTEETSATNVWSKIPDHLSFSFYFILFIMLKNMVTMESFGKGSSLYVLYDNEQMPQPLISQGKHCS